MEPTISYSERYDKLKTLLRVFLYQSPGGISIEDMETMFFWLESGELSELCKQLLDDGIICYAGDPYGLVLRLTESGMELILDGAYARQERARTTEFGRWSVNSLKKHRILKYFLPGFICLLLLFYCLSCH
jgi:hypothetical protein